MRVLCRNIFKTKANHGIEYNKLCYISAYFYDIGMISRCFYESNSSGRLFSIDVVNEKVFTNIFETISYILFVEADC